MIEICRQRDCQEPAQVLVETDLVWMDGEGVESRGRHVIAMCRKHALTEAGH